MPSPVLQFRLPEDLITAVEDAARSQRRSRASFIKLAIMEAVIAERRRAKKSPKNALEPDELDLLQRVS